MRRVVVLFVAMAAMAALAVQPAEARSPWLRVTIEDTFPVDFGEGVFTASGPAVDADAICPSGTTTVTSATRRDLSPEWALLRIKKVATCDDSSGTFDIKLRVFLNVTEGSTHGRWKSRGGTDAYAGLRGVGVITGDPTGSVDGTFLDTYTGYVRN